MNTTLKAINWEECIKVTNNPKLAKDLLIIFSRELPTFESTLKKAQKQKNREELVKILHKLQGSSSYCGVTHLKNIASNLEKYLKEKNNNEKIANLFEKLFQEIDLVKVELKSVVARNS
jgi:two-component system, NarL family, sensor histidine kinase BarA